jgi:hypothetical protein
MQEFRGCIFDRREWLKPEREQETIILAEVLLGPRRHQGATSPFMVTHHIKQGHLGPRQRMNVVKVSYFCVVLCA